MTDKRTGEIYPGPEIFGASDEEEGFRCPYGEPGARLWVRETFTAHGAFGTDGRIAYRADASGGKEPHGLNWKPSIFMPRKASRITLEIVGVRVERLQDISERDAIAEGVERDAMCGPCSWYQMIWEKINGKGSWAKNSFVWVLEFKRI
jgi:hypothetical protein